MMRAKIVCYFGDMQGESLTRTFLVNDPELAMYQVCYFDRFIPLFEENIEMLKKSFTFATLQKIFVIVSCHGYNHNYEYKNGKLTVLPKVCKTRQA
jgi:hypothetical protein